MFCVEFCFNAEFGDEFGVGNEFLKHLQTI